MYSKVVPIEDAIAIIHNGDTVATNGYGGNGTPEKLFAGIEMSFLESGTPNGLTLVYAGGQGDGRDKGLNRLAHEGLLKRVIGGHYGLMPKVERLAVDNSIEAYNLPEGVITHLYRDIAAKKPGTFSKVGLGTFVDPRVEGGKMNAITMEDIIEVVTYGGEEYLFFKAFPIHVAFIRGTTADPDGNITMEKESLTLENLSMAIAARNSGGCVVCQVERVAERGSLDSRQVKIPGIMVDCVVLAEPEYHMQTYGTQYNPAYSGEIRAPLETLDKPALDERKVIARRAALELTENSVVNLGIGLPDVVGSVAHEEKIHDLITLTVDPGIIGGVPMGGLDFGAAVNCQAVIDHSYEFDFIDGGGLDTAYLGFAQCDHFGNINASRFANRLVGCGGFINISQNSRKVVFLGTFTSGGLEVGIIDGKLQINKEGRFGKFLEQVDQITFNGEYATRRNQEVYYITERCVFMRGTGGLALTEIAPGIDLERDVLALLPFEPFIDGPQLMDQAIFQTQPMELRDRLLDMRIQDRISYDPAKNVLFLDYAGLHVRTQADLDEIKQAVEQVLKPLGRRVYAVVNYERFVADDAIADAYMDLVKYVEENYYIKVSRYTTSGFLRVKLGKELGKRAVTSQVFESDEEALIHVRQ
jgi:propionate CoA-transferase